jgi:Domain of unknown function (DUF4157)
VSVRAESALASVRDGGQPLPRSVRTFFEPRFGADFSKVRIHSGSQAAESTRSIRARAFTFGRDVVFGRGEYLPERQEGQWLLAHELTHVVQQGYAPALPVDSSSAQLGAAQVMTRAPADDRIARQSNGDADSGVPPSDAADAGGTTTGPKDDAKASPDQPGGTRYSLQAACVARAGGCASSRDGGVPEPAEITRYNAECKRETDYDGPDITLSEDECRQYTTRQLIDPEKLLRLETLTSQYLERLTRGELTVGDAQQIDAALRFAHAALARGGRAARALPAPVARPPTVSPDLPVFPSTPTPPRPAVASAPIPPPVMAPMAPPLGPVVGPPPVAPTPFVGPPTVAPPPGAAVPGAAAAEASLLEMFGVAFIALAVTVIGVGLLWLIATGEESEVDPTIPQDLDKASEKIAGILKAAKKPILPPIAEPVPNPTPEPGPRRWPNQTCEDNVLDKLEEWMHKVCDIIPSESCSPAKVSPKRLARRPCSEIRGRIDWLQECLWRRNWVQVDCFGGQPDKKHQDVIDEINNAIAACKALEAINCAPGHPMADL